MTVWPYLMGLSWLCLIVAAVARDRALTVLAASIAAAYIGGRLVKAGLPADLHLLAFAVMWLSVAICDAIQRQVDTKTALLAAVALCYLWAKRSVAPWVYGSLPFVLSDLCAAAVMLLILKGAGRAFVGRVAYMGYSSGRGLPHTHSGMQAMVKEVSQG